MPRYIEQLNENTTPATGDWLWIVDVSAEATDQDRKLSVGKLALLATANVFTAAQTIGPTGGYIVATVTDSHVAGVALVLNATATNGKSFQLLSTAGASGFGGNKLVLTDDGTRPFLVVHYSTGNVSIGTTTDSPSAQLQIGGTTGALLLSRLSTTQRDDDLTTPINGMILYNSSTNKFQGYENGEWVNLI